MRRALAGCVLLAAPAHAEGAKSGTAAPSYAIVSHSPSLEIRFRGVSLDGAHTDAKQNQIALDLDTPIDIKLFDRLQKDAADWVDMAYGGYDNAVIHARRPVQFVTRKESDGFSLSLVTTPLNPKPTPPVRDSSDHTPPDGMQKIDAPFTPPPPAEAKRGSVLDSIGKFLGGIF